MDENITKWVWLTSKKGMVPEKICSLLNKFNDIYEIYNAKEEDYQQIELIRRKDIENLCDKDLSHANEIIRLTNEIGGYIITIDSKDYPEKLKRLVIPAYVLYVKGPLKIDKDICSIGIVGTRYPVEYGAVATEKMAFELAKAGFLVVSGLARGVDAIAASAALRAGGNTIAVLGFGLDVLYPKCNEQIKEYVESYGAIITEYPPKTPPYATNFPQRNRIIAALSDGLLVTQAPSGSGALITARLAHDIGVDVYSVPASVFDKNCVGNNNLIKAGAIAVTHPNDLIQAYEHKLDKQNVKDARNFIKIEKTNTNSINRAIRKTVDKITEKKDSQYENLDNSIKYSISDERFGGLDEEEKKIIALIIEKERISVDEIIRQTKMLPAKTGSCLALLEMKGHIRKLAGNFYEIK